MDPPISTSYRGDSSSYSPGIRLTPLTIEERRLPNEALELNDYDRGHVRSYEGDGRNYHSRVAREYVVGEGYRERTQSPKRESLVNLTGPRRPWTDVKADLDSTRAPIHTISPPQSVNESVLGLKQDQLPNSKRRMERSRSGTPLTTLDLSLAKNEGTLGRRPYSHADAEEAGKYVVSSPTGIGSSSDEITLTDFKTHSSIRGVDCHHLSNPRSPTFGPYEASLSSRRYSNASMISPYSVASNHAVPGIETQVRVQTSIGDPSTHHNPDSPFSIYQDGLTRERNILERQLNGRDEESQEYDMLRSRESLGLDRNDVQAAEMLANLDRGHSSKKRRTSSDEDQATMQPAASTVRIGIDGGQASPKVKSKAKDGEIV
jgi:hypothetical protein